MYSNNKVSNGSYLCFMTYRTEDGLMRVYTARLETSFVLGEDIYIMSSSKKSHMGLFSTTSQYVLR